MAEEERGERKKMRVKYNLLELGMQLWWLRGAEVGAANYATKGCLWKYAWHGQQQRELNQC